MALRRAFGSQRAESTVKHNCRTLRGLTSHSNEAASLLSERNPPVLAYWDDMHLRPLVEPGGTAAPPHTSKNHCQQRDVNANAGQYCCMSFKQTLGKPEGHLESSDSGTQSYKSLSWKQAPPGNMALCTRCENIFHGNCPTPACA